MTLPLHDLPLFLLAALLVNLTPGPDMLFVAGTSAAQGRRCGSMAALGVGAGCFVHIALAAVGLSALLATSALAFEVIKWIGAAYLVWVGVSMLRRTGDRASAVATAVATAVEPGPDGETDAGLPAKAFWRGAMTNALNPKVALFFIAFLPQFIEPGSARQAWAFAALGLLFTIGGTAVNLAVAALAGSIAQRMAAREGSGAVARWLRRAAGIVFVGLGLRLAFSTR
jgi:threonine/homoserine/homoserine lactone efflux protein